MNPTQPAKYRPLTERERRAVVQKINAAELAELRADASLTPDPYRLQDGIPVLRVVAGERRVHVAGNTAPRPSANPPIPTNPQPIEQVEFPSHPPFGLADWALVALVVLLLTLIIFNVAPLVIALVQLGFGA